MKRLTFSTPLVVTALLLAASFAFVAATYPALPDPIVTHWNAAGIPNGFAPKGWQIFLPSLIALVLVPLLLVLPRLDPIDKGFRSFLKEYHALIALVTGMLAAVQVLIVAWNLGVTGDLTRFFGPIIGLFFFGLGRILPRLKRNYFAGIRTPWTLSSDRVWQRTHAQAGAVFQMVGLIACLGALFPAYTLMLVAAPIVAGVAWVIIYSYLVFREGA